MPGYSVGTTGTLPGGVRNDFLRNINTETLEGVRTALVAITNTRTGRSTQASLQVNLTVNDAPVITAVTAYNAATGLPPVNSTFSKASSPVVKFSGTANDPNGDILYYRWAIVQPVNPASLILYGRDIYIDISGYDTDPDPWSGVLGSVKVVDKFGLESTSFTLPSIAVTT